MALIKQSDAERFRRIQRDVGLGYAVTLKDLRLLVRLVEKLEKERESLVRELGKDPKPKAREFLPPRAH